MKKLHFETIINAPAARVWDTMLEDKTYRQWTEAFGVGSYYKGSWEEGSKILFLGPNPDGGGASGMVARIKENRPQEFLSIEHLGIVDKGVEDTTSESARRWAPAYENYTFEETNGSTTVSIDVDTDDEHIKMFEGMWPKALQRLKELCEE